MIRRPPRSTLSSSSAASDVYKRQGPGNFSLDEVIIRILKSEDEEVIIPSTKSKNLKETEVKEETSKGGLFQFLQANILSDTSS